MGAGITTIEFNNLRSYIEDQCGITLGDEKAYLIETRLTKLMALNGCDDFTSFYDLAKSGKDLALKDKIIDAMTTNETLWFRDTHPYTILKEKMLQSLISELKEGKRDKVRIWSAASSTGQEPYSIAITICELCDATIGITPDQFEIVGTDISASALFLANAGRYDTMAMGRGMPDNLRAKYFKQDNRVWEVSDEIKNMVTFKKFNLQDSTISLGKFDIVFLRYVAIYFSDDFKRSLYEKIARSLNKPGYYIIGAVETLRGLSEDFQIQPHAGGHYYVLKS